jgi:ATP-dependent Clp protease ATP-binding subunit ClpC
MFERYTELARRALFFARYEASMLGGRAIETEHLLLGLLKDRELLITHLLDTSPVTADAIRQLIYTRVGAATSPLDTSVEIPFSEDAKQVLEYTAEEANRLLHQHIGCEHLLLGLLRLERGLAWDVLRERGVELRRWSCTSAPHHRHSRSPECLLECSRAPPRTRGARLLCTA